MAEVLEKQYTAKKVAERQDSLLSLAREALAASDATETQVRIFDTDSALTRFANSEIHQNNFERQAMATVTARFDSCEGMVSTNRLTSDGLKQAVSAACSAARISEPNPDLAEFAEGPRWYPLQVDYYEPTAASTPEQRADMVIEGFKVSEDPAFTAAGTLGTSQLNVVIANSRGIEVAYNTTQAKYGVMYTGSDSSGYSEVTERDIRHINTEEHARRALATAQRSAKPRNDIPAGKYTVVLLPDCLTTMLNFLNWTGFSGRDYADGSSFLCGKLGEPVTGNMITVTDDPLDPQTFGVPSDMSGLPKQRLSLIESGVAKAVAHDRNSAKRMGTTSTGHDTGGNFPIPTNLVLSPGTSSLDEMIRSIDRGILVSRFHYTNVVDPMNTVITGMTRDGTFLIENGEIGSGLTNFRFTQNVLEAFSNATSLASNQVFQAGFWGGGCLVPEAIAINEFNFSGKTAH